MMSSLDSERSCLMQRNSSAHADDNTLPRDCKYSVAAVGKRSYPHHQHMAMDVEEECSKRSRIEYSDATVSGVTFQNDSNLHHVRIPDADSDAASVARHVGSCHSDLICLNSRRSKFVASCSNEMDVDSHGMRRKGADRHVTFISSRVQENKDKMLSVVRQGTRGTDGPPISSCRQSSDGSHSNSRITSFPSFVRDPSQTSPTNCQKPEARMHHGLVFSKHITRSPQISSAESQDTSFLNVDAMCSENQNISFFNGGSMRLRSVLAHRTHQHTSFLNVDRRRSKGMPAETMHAKGSPVDATRSKDFPPSYVLSSGRSCLEQEANLGRRLQTIDDDFEEYFSSLIL